MSWFRVCKTAVLAVAVAFIVGVAADDGHNLDLLKLLNERPWVMTPRLGWTQHPQFDPDITGVRTQPFDLRRMYDQERLGFDKFILDPKIEESDDGERGDKFDDGFDILRDGSEKRSAVATALNSGRRRRQPAPALGKVIMPYLGVGVLTDVGQFFDSLRDNLEVIASMSPQQRATLLHETPTVVHAPVAGGGSGGGMRRLHALRPLRPTGNIRSYNRRSFVEADGGYPGANHHDPGLLWTGLGRR